MKIETKQKKIWRMQLKKKEENKIYLNLKQNNKIITENGKKE